MEEVKYVTENLFNWVLTVGTGIISLIMIWLARLQWKFNNTDKGLAVNERGDEARDVEIHAIKLNYNLLLNKMDTILLVVREQKEMHNTLLIRINKLLDEIKISE